MTGSLGWADNVILAMAPLGIVTIIVAAIRVGGPLWMKRIIGRSREPMASAEMELMSSTSPDVSELWNGQGLVRVAGTGPVHQFMILPSTSPKTTDVVWSVLQHPELEETSSKSFLRSFLAMLSPNRHRERQINLDETGVCEPPLKLEESSGQPQNSFLLVEKSGAAPNISLNLHGSTKFELGLMAVFGTMLQFAVLAFCGWTAYWPHEPGSILLKDEEPAERYAFPCTLSGTLLLVVGLTLCAHVVESRTIETEFRAGGKTSGRLLWIQRAATVSDQTFGSYALYADRDPFVLRTSRRADTVSRRTKTNKGQIINEGLEAFRQTETIIGVSIGLVGFVVQFIGLRGMSWSAALAQLIATLAMTAIRAWARRESDSSFHAIPLDPGFELDWVASNLGPYGDIEESLDVENMPPGSSEDKSLDLTAKMNSKGLFQTRASLASLVGLPSHWPRVGAVEAIKLVSAIEKTLDLLLKDEDEFTWQHQAFNNRTIEMRAERKHGKWQATQLGSVFEAALSLWLFSVRNAAPNVLGESGPSDAKPTQADQWLMGKEPGLIILDQWSYRLARDLYYWLPANIASSVVVSTKVESPATNSSASPAAPTENRDESRPSSSSPGSSNSSDSSSGSTSQVRKVSAPRVVGFGGSAHSSSYLVQGSLWNAEKKPELIAAEMSTSLPSLYTQHIYAVFMQGLSHVVPEISNDDSTWWEEKSGDHLSGMLSNINVSNLVDFLQEIQLFTPKEAYLAIIPSLSKNNNLAKPETVLRNMLLSAHHQRRCDEVVPRLLSRFRDKESVVHFEHAPSFLRAGLRKRTSALLWSCVNLIPCKSFQSGNEGKLFHFEYRKMRPFRLPYSKETMHAVENWSYNDAKDLAYWMLSYIWQNRLDPDHHIRAWPLYVNVRRGEKGKEYSRRMLRYCQHSTLHQAFRSGSQDEMNAALLEGKDISEGDIWGWKVLHYAAALMASNTDPRFPAALEALKIAPSMIDTRDLIGWTPLHYAAKNPNAGRLLDHILEHSNANEYDSESALDLSTPLHCAAEMGLVNHIEKLRRFKPTRVAKKWFSSRDHRGFTPLHRAILGGHVEATRAILTAVSQWWGRDEYWLPVQEHWRYIHFAIWSGNMEIFELLPVDRDLVLDWITWADINGLTPLHMAVARGNTDFVKVLIERFTGAESPDMDGNQLSRKDEAGYTPLDIAKQEGFDEICTLLQEAGADLGTPDRNKFVWDRADPMMQLPT